MGGMISCAPRGTVGARRGAAVDPDVPSAKGWLRVAPVVGNGGGLRTPLATRGSCHPVSCRAGPTGNG